MNASLNSLWVSAIKVFGEFRGQRAVIVGWQASPEGSRAIAALRTLWRMPPGSDTIYIGDRWESRSISDVVEWAIEQCEIREPAEIVKQLAEFRSAATVERIHYALVPDVWMEGELDSFRFHDGTVLAKLALHPDRSLLSQIDRFEFSGLPRHRLDLYLAFGAVESCHFGERPIKHDMSDDRRLSDVAMCINLSRPVDSAIALSAFSNFYPGDNPLTLRGFSWSIPHTSKPAMQNGIIEVFLRSADQLYKEFSACNEDVQARVRVAARYLSQMGMALHEEDKLISLRVALEVFFCDPPAENTADPCHVCGQRPYRGPSWMVKHRPALMLGKSETERRELRKLFGDVYRVLSRTAHTGRLGESYDYRKAELVATHLRNAIRHQIEHGQDFEWEEAR